jgi:hypothetical protein
MDLVSSTVEFQNKLLILSGAFISIRWFTIKTIKNLLHYESSVYMIVLERSYFWCYADIPIIPSLFFKWLFSCVTASLGNYHLQKKNMLCWTINTFLCWFFIYFSCIIRHSLLVVVHPLQSLRCSAREVCNAFFLHSFFINKKTL